MTRQAAHASAVQLHAGAGSQRRFCDVWRMYRFVRNVLEFSRVQCQLPQQALTEKNVQLRRQFVAN